MKQVGVIGLLLGVGAWPYVPNLRFWPFTRDAVEWITRGSLYQHDWYRWVFAESHFVGYRPVAALSYTLNYLAAGLNPLIYRVTDLGLHLLAGLLVGVLFRRLVRGAPAWGAVVAAGLFMAHPAVENVVPFIARRSYTLATVFSLSALIVLCPLVGDTARSTRTAGGSLLWGRSLIAGLLFLCACLSNEVAFVTLPVVPLILMRHSWTHRARWTRILVLCTGPFLAGLAAAALRDWIIGGIGGYMSLGRRPERFYPILRDAWRSLGAFSSPFDGGQPEDSWWLTAYLAVIGSYYFFQAFIAPAGLKPGGRRLLPAILVIWLTGYSLLYALTGVWFLRQVYPMLIPLSLLVGSVLVEVIQRYRLRRWALAFHLIPQMLLVAAILVDSPLIHGPHP